MKTPSTRLMAPATAARYRDATTSSSSSKTPRRGPFLLLLLEVLAELDGVVVRLLRLLVGVRRLPYDPSLDALFFISFFRELFRVVQGLLRSLELGRTEGLLVVGVVGRRCGRRRRLRLELELRDRHGHQISFFRRLRRARVAVASHELVVPVFSYWNNLVDGRRVVPRYRL